MVDESPKPASRSHPLSAPDPAQSAEHARPVARAESQPHSSPRVRSRLGILFVDADRISRTSTARAMLRAGWGVTVVDSEAELANALATGDTVDVAMVDASHPVTQAILETLVEEVPFAALIVRAVDIRQTGELLTALGLVHYEVLARDAPSEEVLDAVRRAVDGWESGRATAKDSLSGPSQGDAAVDRAAPLTERPPFDVTAFVTVHAPRPIKPRAATAA